MAQRGWRRERDGRALPMTWRWCCASVEAIQFWINEGVDGSSDIASMYTSTTEVRASLLQAGLNEDDVSRGILAWLDAPRAA